MTGGGDAPARRPHTAALRAGRAAVLTCLILALPTTWPSPPVCQAAVLFFSLTMGVTFDDEPWRKPRDLLPLPRGWDEPAPKRSLSRAVRRRITKR